MYSNRDNVTTSYSNLQLYTYFRCVTQGVFEREGAPILGDDRGIRTGAMWLRASRTCRAEVHHGMDIRSVLHPHLHMHRSLRALGCTDLPDTQLPEGLLEQRQQ